MPPLKLVSTEDSPLDLLRKVRDIMRQDADAQARLGHLVQAISRQLGAEVCSVYFARSGNELELFATHGLKAEAVHQTRLRFGEGLVGEIAATASVMNLPDAAKHPKFAYRPETGEEAFHAFIGVPVFYHHRVIGVLVVQSQDVKIFSDEQAEVLQTIAMILAETAIASQVVTLSSLTGEQDATQSSHCFTGMRIAPGLAMGPVVLHRPKINVERLITDNTSYEEERLDKALGELQASIDEMVRKASGRHDGKQNEILETYRMFTRDKGWIRRIGEAINNGLTAEAAVKKVEEEMHARMQQIESDYILQRMQDLEDLSERLLYHLAGVMPTAAHGDLPDAFILVASSLGPAELLEYQDHNITGVILDSGSAASHVAIIARMLDIPMVAGIRDVARLARESDQAILDGDSGEVYIRPPQDIRDAIAAHIAGREKLLADYAAAADDAPVTQDGFRISLNLNTGLGMDGEALRRPDVDGIGLYRTELPYLANSDMPDVDEQKQIYGNIFRYAAGKPVIFRSFDIGGDKQVSYLDAGEEENPAMGWRATRVGLDRPVILRRQFRALIRAAGGQPLHIMFPFIAEVAEFDETRSMFERELERAKVENVRLPQEIRIGCMIEIPSLLWQLPLLFSKTDFVSVGSNDLLQFLFACDRGSERLSGRYDPLSPTVLRILCDLAKQADKQGVKLSFCGAMASRPIEAMALLGCGITHLSMPVGALGPVKAMLRAVNMADLRTQMQEWKDLQVHSVRSHLEAFAKANSVPL
jgi:phosphotransferase system enzyme I (PtsP)